MFDAGFVQIGQDDSTLFHVVLKPGRVNAWHGQASLLLAAHRPNYCARFGFLISHRPSPGCIRNELGGFNSLTPPLFRRPPGAELKRGVGTRLPSTRTTWRAG